MWKAIRSRMTVPVVVAWVVGIVMAVFPETGWLSPTTARSVTIVGVAIILFGVGYIIRNDMRLRRGMKDPGVAARNKTTAATVDSETIPTLKELRDIFAKLHDCQEKLVQATMKSDWKAYVKHLQDQRHLKQLVDRYGERGEEAAVKSQLHGA